MSQLQETAEPSMKARLAAGDKLRLIEVHSGLSSIVANAARAPSSGRAFDGVWVSSLTATASIGLPDLEIPFADNTLQVVEEVARHSSKPIVVDGGTGGDATALRYLCRELERLGASAVILEDKSFPKRNSLVGSDQTLLPPEEFADKIWSAKDVIRSDLMVIGRIESFISGEGLAAAVRRARIYAEAGADGLMIHSRAKTSVEIRAFAEVVTRELPRIPLFCVPTTYYTETASALFDIGFGGVIYANHQLRAAHAAMERACLAILGADSSAPLESDISSTARIFDEVGYTAELERLARAQAGASGRRTHAV